MSVPALPKSNPRSRAWYRKPHQRKAGRAEISDRTEFARTKRMISAAIVLWEKRRGLYHDPAPFGGSLYFGKQD